MKPKKSDANDLKRIASEVRFKIIEIIYDSQAPHLGSSLSCVDIFVALYWKVLNNNPEMARKKDVLRDRCILSKGHAAPTLFAALAKRGYFPEKMLDNYLKDGSCLAEHPGPSCVPGVELATGSLGHGLSVGLGMAIASRVNKQDYKVYIVMSDGELNEGSVWEAAMFAAAQKAGNLVAIIDYNKWQATARSREVMALEPLKQKWDAFGWNAYEINGHDINEIIKTLENIPKNDKPSVIIAHTIKGKGVSFMEDDNNWHYKAPTHEEVQKAKKELGLA
ncbi:transketolase [Candidatus Woesearchaeota archaeon]|nr:transketolase [Candidatus Woesearchaeota archaeon]